MPIFISYSHSDKDFVDQLALHLVANKVHVWLDRWEIHVGDSLLTRVQEAITGASALLVILSKASVVSEWCKKELNAGLIRELAEKRVLVLPVLKEKCDIPLFLKEKMYADFTKDFDAGLETVLEAVAGVTNDKLGRIDAPRWHTDWAIDWGKIGGRDILRLTMVETPEDQPYIVLATVLLVPDNETTRWYRKHVKQGTDRIARRDIIVALAKAVDSRQDMEVMLRDEMEQVRYARVAMKHGNLTATIQVRRLGMDTGRTILFRLPTQIDGVAQSIKEITAGEEEESKSAPSRRKKAVPDASLQERTRPKKTRGRTKRKKTTASTKSRKKVRVKTSKMNSEKASRKKKPGKKKA